MIFVTRKEDENPQKVVANFLKRVKKFNLIARSRKTRHHTKKRTSRVAKEKALKTAAYLKKNEYTTTHSKY
jgi:hypothetical protein